MKATACKLCGAPRDMRLKGAPCSDCNREYFRRLRAKRRPSQTPLSEQVCAKCTRLLPISDFHLSSAYSSGYSAICRECVAFYRAVHRTMRRQAPASITCKSCAIAKPPSAFYRSAEGGWRRTCKVCFKQLACARLEWLKAHNPAEYERQQQMSRDRAQRSRRRSAASVFQRLVHS